MKKRVLIAAIHFAYLNGGGEHYPLNLADNLPANYQREFLCGCDLFQPPHPLSHRFPIHYVPFLHFLRHRGEQLKGKLGVVFRSTHYFVYLLGATAFMITHYRRFPLVNAHDVISLQAANWAKKFVPIKVVATLHGTPLPLEQRALRQADAVISVNSTFKDELAKVGITEVTVTPTGMDPRIFYPGSQADARKKVKLPNDKKIALFAGRMVPIKNIAHLLKAFVDVARQVPGSRLVLVGEGSIKSELEQLAKELTLTEVVEFRPAVPQRDLAQYYRAADLFVLPSLSEAFPMVGVEALACGLPMVMTEKSPGFQCVFPPSVVKVFSPTDPQQTADVIIQALSSDQSKVVSRQLELVKDFTWLNQAAKTVKVYEEVCR